MSQPGADPLVGRTVAQYEIVARLGGGGMGVVYRAIDRKLGRPVALKFLPQQWSHDEGAKQRFLREAQAASATDHPNICTIHDIATADDGQLFIVMAHYAGETLKRRLEAGPLPIDQALDIATQVADGLARAHAQGIVHRDIKPGNLILTEDGVRIVDFGLATFVDALQLTAEGSTLGTAAYMSPEQVRGEEVDARTDVWAVGVVLYQMLVGHTPFRGAYAEAIGYAIRNDPPPPLRAERPEIPEDIEQLVFRALHKDPAIRFPTGRELARALRQVRGLTVPMDLRTMPVPAPAVSEVPVRRWRRLGIAAALAAVMLAVAATALLLFPGPRVSVAVMPVVNQSGEDDLDGFRFALTHELVRQLTDSRVIRVVPYERLLQILRPFRAPGKDPSSNEAVNAVRRHSGVTLVVTPTLLKTDGAWRLQVEYRDASTLTSEGMDEVTSGITVLKGEAFALTAPLVARIAEHFTRAAPMRVYLAERLRGAIGRGSRGATRLRTLEAAALFEQGIDFYEQQEYDDARRLFEEAVKDDSSNPLLRAWQSRTARAMRRDDEAAAAADRASALLTPQIPPFDRLLIDATVAEARGETEAAARAFGAVVDRLPDEPAWLIERGAFEDRQLRNTDAIASYHAALALDPKLARPRLELCRLYAPGRVNLPVNAREQGELALTRYRELGGRAGEMQALWCLTDVLRSSPRDLPEARTKADDAMRIAEDLGGDYDYNLARAANYVALAASQQARTAEAVAFWLQAEEIAARVGNMALQPLVMMQLGVANRRLGNVAEGVNYFRRSAAAFQALGQQQRAAESQANIAQIVVDHGGDLDAALRDNEDALAVFRRYKDNDFEVFSMRVRAASYRNAGRYTAAEKEIGQALSIAGEHNLHEKTARLLIDRATLKLELGDFAAARDFLTKASALDAGANAPEISILAGRIAMHDGDLPAARLHLQKASELVEKSGSPALVPSLYLALGEVDHRAGVLASARAHFDRAMRAANSQYPDEAAVAAGAYLGLIDATAGKPDAGRRIIMTSLEHAKRMQRHALEVRCRAYLAKSYLAQRRVAEAVSELNQLPAAGPEATIGPALRAEIDSIRAAAGMR